MASISASVVRLLHRIEEDPGEFPRDLDINDAIDFFNEITPEGTKGESVVLIDELDAHLHPLWQQRIGRWLLDKFTNLQFITATHSPFLAQVAQDKGNVVLRRRQQRVIVENDTAEVKTWRYETILQELFGLKSARAPGVERLLQKLAKLTMKEDLNEREQEEKTQLELELGELPPDYEHIQDRQVTLKLHDLLAETAK